MEISQATVIGLVVLAIIELLALAVPLIKLTTVINNLTNAVNNLSEKYTTLNDRVTKHGEKLDEHDQHLVKVDCEIDNLKEAKSNTKHIDFIQESKKGGKR